MVKKSWRSRRTTVTAAPAATQNQDETYKAPTLELKDIVLTEGTAQDAARFEEVLRTLASHVGTQPWSQSSEIAKAMVELKAPVHAEPLKPICKYYVHQEDDAVPGERVQTTNRFRADGTTLNEEVIDKYK